MIAPWVELGDLPTPLPALPEEEWDATIALASEVLWALSARRWSGAATRTVEVVAPARGRDLPYGWHISWGWDDFAWDGPLLIDGQIINRRQGAAPTQVRLPGSPTAVSEVTYRGTAYDPATYRLRGAYLEKVSPYADGWPICDPGIVVTYTSGKPPPEGGRRAAALYAWELGRGRIGDPACGLPGNVTSILRQGIQMSFVPASQIIALGQVGLLPVDTWLATVNPGRLTRRARAWSPDTATRTYRRTAP